MSLRSVDSAPSPVWRLCLCKRNVPVALGCKTLGFEPFECWLFSSALLYAYENMCIWLVEVVL